MEGIAGDDPSEFSNGGSPYLGGSVELPRPARQRSPPAGAFKWSAQVLSQLGYENFMRIYRLRVRNEISELNCIETAALGRPRRFSASIVATDIGLPPSAASRLEIFATAASRSSAGGSD